MAYNSSDLTLVLSHIRRFKNDITVTKAGIMDDIHFGKITNKEISLIPVQYLDMTNLPGVPKDNIMTPSKAYKPFRYEFGYHAWLQQNQSMWLPEDIPMIDDVKDWNSKLTDAERNLMTHVFPLFVQNDILINNVYIHHYAKLFLPNEVQMGLSAIANMESTHTAAYAHLLDSLSFPEDTYSAFLQYKEMNDKYNYTAGFDTNTLIGIAIALVVFGGLTEGLQLFATFAIMMNFPRYNKLKGMGQIVSYSVRDESSHVTFVAQLYKYFMAEFGHLIDKDTLHYAVYEAARDIVKFESEFSRLAFSMGDVEGMTLAEHNKYINYIADMRLKQFGFDPIFNEEENPYPWIDRMIGGLELTNFFEGRATEYSKSSTEGTWESAWT